MNIFKVVNDTDLIEKSSMTRSKSSMTRSQVHGLKLRQGLCTFGELFSRVVNRIKLNILFRTTLRRTLWHPGLLISFPTETIHGQSQGSEAVASDQKKTQSPLPFQ